MRFILVSARKDLRRRFADLPSLLIWVGIPLLVGGLLSLLGTGSGATPTALLLIVDQDDSLVSGLLTGAASQDGVADFLRAESVTEADGRARLDAGDGSALLIIPQGFGDAVLLEEPAELTLITNPAQQIFPGIIEEGLQIMLEGAFYAQQVLGEPLRTMIDLGSDETDGPTLEQVTELSTLFYERVESVEGLLFPPVLQLQLEEQEADEAAASGGVDLASLFLPAILFMSILFVAQGMSDDLWHESRQGTLRRLLSSPRGAEQLLAGKLLAGMVIMAAVAAAALLVARLRLDVELSRLPLALLWCVFAGGVMLTYFLAVQALAGSQRGGTMLSNLILFPIMMVGGAFFPFAAMPQWMAAIGRRTPNGLALTRFEQLLFGAPAAAELMMAALAIGLPAAIAFLVCAARMRRAPLAAS